MMTSERLTKPQTSAEAKALIRRLTQAQRRTLDNLGAGGVGGHPEVLKRLEDFGLLEGFERVLPGRFPMRIREYSVPVFVHIAWCELCTEELK